MSASTKILFLAAAPGDRARLRTDQELRDIEEALRRAGLREKFAFTARHAVGATELRRAVLEEKPDILHFAGHGDADGIALEDEQGQSRRVPVAALADLFRLFADKLHCVVLNACYSEAQAEAIAKHIAYVAGMKSEISDQAAHDFAVGFYDALGRGRDIEFAFEYARNAIHLEGHEAEHLTPVLFNRNAGKSLSARDEAQPERAGRQISPDAHCSLDFKKLCYWVDRVEQEITLARALKTRKAARPFLCFMHGEEHDHALKFLEFLQDKTLKEYQPELNTGIKAIRCGRFRNRTEFQHQLELGLATLFLPSGSLPEIADRVAQTPVLLFVTVKTEDWKTANGAEMLDAFVEFWRKWPDTGLNSALLIASLSFCYEPEETGFLGRWLKKPSLNAEIESHIQALQAVLAGHAELSGVVALWPSGAGVWICQDSLCAS